MRAIGQITITNICDVVASDTPPENPYIGQLWVDTSVNPPETKVWNGDSWEVQNDLETIRVVISTLTTKTAELQSTIASWGCATRITNGRQACDTHHINETVLEATYLAALRDLLDNASDVVEAVKEGAELALEPENRAAIERVEAEIVGIQEAVLELHRAKQRMELGAAEYTAKVKEYSELMKAKEAERDALQDTAVKYTEVKTWLDTFMDQIMQSTSLTKVDGTTMKILVEKIIARDTGIEVIFKCGVSVEHEYVK